MAEAPIGMPDRALKMFSSKLTSSSPRWRDWVPQGWLCSPGKHGYGEALGAVLFATMLTEFLKNHRIFLSIPTPLSLDGLSCVQKSGPETLWSKISCAETKQPQLGQCCKSRIRYADKGCSGSQDLRSEWVEADNWNE